MKSSSRGLRLHDAQSCIAREHGFASWPDLKRYVEVQAVAQQARAVRVLHWLQLVYRGDISNTSGRTNLRVGLRMLAEDPGLLADDPYLACAIGDEATLRRATQADPSWVNRPGGPLQCRRFSPSRIPACCGWRNFARACTEARGC